MAKLRLDLRLVADALAPSRRKAEALIRTGGVLVNDAPIEKPGHQVAPSDIIRLRVDPSPYVGRGGDKLAAALDHFTVDVAGLVVLDVGSSTGGFTDCLLSRGAARVYAVDVGFNQLAHSLRTDRRVVVMERTNAKALTPSEFDPLPSFASIDVSFIGLRKVLLPVVEVVSGTAMILALVKPQFELGREFVKKGGVVPELQLQTQAVQLVADYAQSIGLVIVGSVASVLKGSKKGNQEYFLFMKKMAGK